MYHLRPGDDDDRRVLDTAKPSFPACTPCSTSRRQRRHEPDAQQHTNKLSYVMMLGNRERRPMLLMSKAMDRKASCSADTPDLACPY